MDELNMCKGNVYIEDEHVNNAMNRKMKNYSQNEKTYSSPSITYSNSSNTDRITPSTSSTPHYQHERPHDLNACIYLSSPDQYHNKCEHENNISTSECYQTIQSPFIQQVTPNHNSRQQYHTNHNSTCTNEYNLNCEDKTLMHDQTTDAIGTLTLTNPPVVYALHRVVTTAHVPNHSCGTFPTASKISIGNRVPTQNECYISSDTSCLNMKLCDHSGIFISNADCDSTFSNNTTENRPIQPATREQFAAEERDCNTTQNCQTNNQESSEEKPSTSAQSESGVLQNVIPTCVYLMSKVAINMEIENTADCTTYVMLTSILNCEELGIANKLLAQSVFGLWMTSKLLEVQLKPALKPFLIRVAWPDLLDKYSIANAVEKKFDEPKIVLRRNVFFSRRDEEKIKDNRILEFLYEEAKNNVLSGRYVMERAHFLMLGGIQARIELGPYNSHNHTISFFRENQYRFLPRSMLKISGWFWFPISSKNSTEVKLMDQFKRVPQTATTRKLMRKYLEFCWALPFYGSAFFQGQVEQPVGGIMSLVSHKDIEVLVAINERGLFIIDPGESTLLLGLKYEDFSWDFAKPSNSADSECLTCIFIQFDVVENGMQFSKLIQVFSKQAALMDALISFFTEKMLKRKQEASGAQYVEEPNLIQKTGNGVLSNKLSRLTLATFDEEGRCIGQMGSLTISY